MYNSLVFFFKLLSRLSRKKITAGYNSLLENIYVHTEIRLVSQDKCQNLTLTVARISLPQMKAITQLVRAENALR